MWQGSFQPLLHDRVLDDLPAAARNSALDDNYAVLSACTALVWLCFVKTIEPKATRDILAPLACSPRKAVHTRSRGLHNRKESSFDQKPRVTGS